MLSDPYAEQTPLGHAQLTRPLKHCQTQSQVDQQRVDIQMSHALKTSFQENRLMQVTDSMLPELVSERDVKDRAE